jgi:hypothetical protein
VTVERSHPISDKWTHPGTWAERAYLSRSLRPSLRSPVPRHADSELDSARPTPRQRARSLVHVAARPGLVAARLSPCASLARAPSGGRRTLDAHRPTWGRRCTPRRTYPTTHSARATVRGVHGWRGERGHCVSRGGGTRRRSSARLARSRAGTCSTQCSAVGEKNAHHAVGGRGLCEPWAGTCSGCPGRG